MTDTEKVVTKTKEYILNLYSQGYSTHKHMVEGLKNGIDYLVGINNNVATIKDEILRTCLDEFDSRTKVFDKVGHLKMVQAIRSGFIEFVKGLDLNDLTSVTPIPFERRLKNEESIVLTTSLKNKFDFGSWKDENYYWEPLSKTQNTVPLIYFDHNLFKSKEIEIVVDIIKSISQDRIYLLYDENINYEVDASTMHFYWIEYAYCDLNTTWLIYISHEGTITFSGQELLTEIESRLTEVYQNKNSYHKNFR